MALSIVEVTDAAGEIAEPAWLERAEAVHRQLRTAITPGTDAYRARLARVFGSGARMLVAVEGEAVRGVAVWRLVENTYEGRRLYVDDLVSDESRRSTGVGRAMLSYLESRAKDLDCDVLALDSGTQRTRAHRFYFREGMVIPSFCFAKRLKS